jgi:hypothetical protein
MARGSGTSHWAEEGTVAHGLAAEMLHYMFRQGLAIEPSIPDKAMREAINVYTRAIAEDYKSGDTVYIEESIYAKSIDPECHGTPDCLVYTPTSKRLRVFDLKYGAGKYVDVTDNPQLLGYVLLFKYGLRLPVSSAELVIVQPRYSSADSKVRRCLVDAVDIADFEERVRGAIAATRSSDPSFASGSWCRWCPAAVACTQPEKDNPLPEMDFEALDDVRVLDREKLGRILSWLDTVDNYAVAVRAYAFNALEHGEVLPGWALEPGRKGNLRWSEDSEDEVISALRDTPAIELDDTQIFERKLMSPSKLLESLHDKRLAKRIESTMCTRPSPKNKMVRKSNVAQITAPLFGVIKERDV